MSKRVLLLLTGTCERIGLPQALAAAFGGLTDVSFEAYGEYTSFTSADVSVGDLAAQPVSGGRGPVDKLASALLEAGLLRGVHLAIAVDDLELVNSGRAVEVRELFRAAVHRETERAGTWVQSEMTQIAKRCSFHLLAPMVEAYFFGERAAIARALAAAAAPPCDSWSTCGPSLEEFRTQDPAYTDRLLAPDLPRQQRRDDKLLAWRAANREHHPKHYVEFLCREGPWGYREGKAGVAALAALALPSVLAAGAPMLAELLGDIEDGLGLPRVLGATVQTRPAGILRNL